MAPLTLAQTLDAAYREFHAADYWKTDPLQLVHQAPRPEDREATAVLAALLAYGNVATILTSVRRVLSVLEEFGGPARVLAEWSATRDGVSRRLKTFVHRFTGGRDMVCLLEAMAQTQKAHGSIGAHFAAGHTSDALTIEAALSRLIQDWRSESFGGRKNFLLTDPRDGSCCKRWCMLLRWMGRQDEVDLGLWQKSGVQPRQLVMPLDTHTARLSRDLGLTRAKTPSWQVALEVTDRLRELDPEDPTRFDFALCRVGMLRRDLSSLGSLGKVSERTLS